jgi:predicted ArsR family transcriptional regulator
MERASHQLRRVSDAATMFALSHPVRLALVEVLTIHGPLTATGAGELIGESPTTCSFHLRQLARYGFVEEAGGGKGRARPWRMASIGLSLNPDPDDAEGEVAAGALQRLYLDRQLERYRTWRETRAGYPAAWRTAADESEYVFYLTADELRTLNEELHEKLLPLMERRMTDPSSRPPGAVPVEMLVINYPLAVPAPED